MNPEEALLSEMKNMETFIISAAVILGGTFDAMLPLFVLLMVRMFGKANWWLFKKKDNE